MGLQCGLNPYLVSEPERPACSSFSTHTWQKSATGYLGKMRPEPLWRALHYGGHSHSSVFTFKIFLWGGRLSGSVSSGHKPGVQGPRPHPAPCSVERPRLPLPAAPCFALSLTLALAQINKPRKKNIPLGTLRK